MVNIFFFSPQKDLEIKYLKLSIKFDNNYERKASFSFKIWLGKKDFEEIPELYLLMKRDDFFTLEIDEEYNQFLTDEEFKRAAGIDSTEEEIETQEYAVEKIEKFEEDKKLRGKQLLIPRDIHLIEIDPIKINKNLKKQKYIRILRILPIDKETEKSVKIILNDNPIIGFQFRIFFEDFPDQDTLKEWDLSSRPWSVDIGVFEEWHNENIQNYLNNFSLTYPGVFDLWFVIPHNHIFVASSPVYTGVFKLELEDTQYKTYEKYEENKKKFLKKFETLEGDYAVKISSTKKNPQKFSIVCISSFLHGEEPSELRKDMNKFHNELKDLKAYQRDLLRSMISIFGIFVAIFSFIIIGSNYALKIRLPQSISSSKEVFLHISALLSPIFLFLVMLLLISYLITRK